MKIRTVREVTEQLSNSSAWGKKLHISKWSMVEIYEGCDVIYCDSRRLNVMT